MRPGTIYKYETACLPYNLPMLRNASRREFLRRTVLASSPLTFGGCSVQNAVIPQDSHQRFWAERLTGLERRRGQLIDPAVRNQLTNSPLNRLIRYRVSISDFFTMPERSAELLRGTLDLLIMRTLNLRSMHGSAIADRIAQVTNGTFQVKPGSLFPALHRIEQEGWIQGDWVTSAEGRRVRSYSLTRSGHRRMADEKKNWARIVHAMDQVLDSA